MENRATQGRFLGPQFVTFRCQKICKKGYIEITKKFYLETFKKCPGLFCFPLLSCYRNPHITRYCLSYDHEKVNKKTLKILNMEYNDNTQKI